jgi:hypothetical protein
MGAGTRTIADGAVAVALGVCRVVIGATATGAGARTIAGGAAAGFAIVSALIFAVGAVGFATALLSRIATFVGAESLIESPRTAASPIALAKSSGCAVGSVGRRSTSFDF